MTHGSLFSGIGGFDLAAEWMGWENIFHCEWNEFGQKVLKHYWPKAISYHDITKTDFTIHRGRIDILTGGFPCQPYSMAGKRKGKEDERHLWPEMLRAIKEIRPRWVVGENVYGLLNWSGGLVFHEVQTDLEAAGYEVFPYVLPAVSVNAPHRRDRVWFVAYSNTNGLKQQRGYECCCKNDEGGISQSEWAADTKNFNNGDTSKYSAEQSKISGGVITKGYTEKGEFANPRRICNMDKKCNKCEGTIIKDRYSINKSGTLVQEGQSRVQLPINPRMECDKTNTQTNTGIGQNHDNGDIKTMEGYAPHPNGNGFNGSDCQHEVNASEGREYAQRNFEQNVIANTKSIGQSHALENGELERGPFRQSNQRNAWDSFPSVSPICTGDDGLSSRLDGITFSKWRNESIKAAGNAIVPQVALQIFKTIQQYEALPRMAAPI